MRPALIAVLATIASVVFAAGPREAAGPPTFPRGVSWSSNNLVLLPDGGYRLWHNGCDESINEGGHWSEDGGVFTLGVSQMGTLYWPIEERYGACSSVTMVVIDAGVEFSGVVLQRDPEWPEVEYKLAGKTFRQVWTPGWQCPKCGRLGPDSYVDCEGPQLPPGFERLSVPNWSIDGGHLVRFRDGGTGPYRRR